VEWVLEIASNLYSDNVLIDFDFDFFKYLKPAGITKTEYPLHTGYGPWYHQCRCWFTEGLPSMSANIW